MSSAAMALYAAKEHFDKLFKSHETLENIPVMEGCQSSTMGG